MSHYHAIVWIDHQKASTWQLTETEQQHSVVHAPHHHSHADDGKHTKAHHEAADYRFFDEVAKSLAGAHEILVIGPAQTKHDFVSYLGKKHAALASLVWSRSRPRTIRATSRSSLTRACTFRRSTACARSDGRSAAAAY